jgi:antitoxin component YwqK of YwqJK toxin-antitoxin module
MQSKLLDKNFILSNGIEYDELGVDYDRFGDKEFIISEGKEIFFSGITYSLFPNGNLEFYAFFRDGFKEGDFVEFYNDNKIKSMQYRKRGRTYGFRRIWHNNGVLKSEFNYEYGVCLTFKEWNEEGILIEEKLKPTEDDIKLRNSQEKWYKEAIGRE